MIKDPIGALHQQFVQTWALGDRRERSPFEGCASLFSFRRKLSVIMQGGRGKPRPPDLRSLSRVEVDRHERYGYHRKISLTQGAERPIRRPSEALLASW